MKKEYCLICITIILFSCSSIKVDGDAKGCFSKKEALELREDKNKTYEIFSVAPIVKIKNGCVGLYNYSHINRYISTGVKNKVLKFENKIYSFNKADLKLNQKMLNEFISDYDNVFSRTQKDSIRKEFSKGSEMYGRFY